jgi:hypothetical protein
MASWRSIAAPRGEVVEGGSTQCLAEPYGSRWQFLDKWIGRQHSVEHSVQEGRCVTAAKPLEQNGEPPDTIRDEERLGSAVPGVKHRAKIVEGTRDVAIEGSQNGYLRDRNVFEHPVAGIARDRGHPLKCCNNRGDMNRCRRERNLSPRPLSGSELFVGTAGAWDSDRCVGGKPGIATRDFTLGVRVPSFVRPQQ